MDGLTEKYGVLEKMKIMMMVAMMMVMMVRVVVVMMMVVIMRVMMIITREVLIWMDQAILEQLKNGVSRRRVGLLSRGTKPLFCVHLQLVFFLKIVFLLLR